MKANLKTVHLAIASVLSLGAVNGPTALAPLGQLDDADGRTGGRSLAAGRADTTCPVVSGPDVAPSAVEVGRAYAGSSSSSDATGSRWIIPNVNEIAPAITVTSTAPTSLVLQTSADPSTATEAGRWRSDISVVPGIQPNGRTYGNEVDDGQGFTTWLPWGNAGGVVAGLGTGSFGLWAGYTPAGGRNGGSGGYPATPVKAALTTVPEPGTMIAGAGALGLLVLKLAGGRSKAFRFVRGIVRYAPDEANSRDKDGKQHKTWKSHDKKHRRNGIVAGGCQLTRDTQH